MLINYAYERVEAFNRGTNMFNTETGLKTSMFNAESRNAAKRARLGQATTAAQLRQGIKDQDAARRSANITNFLQGLGGNIVTGKQIGRAHV